MMTGKVGGEDAPVRYMCARACVSWYEEGGEALSPVFRVVLRWCHPSDEKKGGSSSFLREA